MKFSADKTDYQLFGLGLGVTLILPIVLGVELINGRVPARQELSVVAGSLIDSQLSKSRGRSYAEVRVQGDSGHLLLLQGMPEPMASRLLSAPSGSAVSALVIDSKESTDSRAGLKRYPMWQLSIDGQQIISYEELRKFHSNEAAWRRKFGYCAALVGLVFLAAFAIRRLRRAQA